MWGKVLDKVLNADGTLLFLFLGILWSTGALIFVDVRFPSDTQIFQIMAQLLSSFVGAFLLKAKGDAGAK